MTAELDPIGALTADRQSPVNGSSLRLGKWMGGVLLQAHTGKYVVAECGGGTFLAADRDDLRMEAF